MLLSLEGYLMPVLVAVVVLYILSQDQTNLLHCIQAMSWQARCLVSSSSTTTRSLRQQTCLSVVLLLLTRQCACQLIT
jgi:hypothetical protein